MEHINIEEKRRKLQEIRDNWINERKKQIKIRKAKEALGLNKNENQTMDLDQMEKVCSQKAYT